MSFVKHREHDWNVLHTRQREVDYALANKGHDTSGFGAEPVQGFWRD
jgi:hypothetical protein